VGRTVKLILTFIFIITTQAVWAQSNDILAFKASGGALNWKQARTECTSIGEDWDLPTVDQALSDGFKSHLINPLKTRELKSQRVKTYFLTWAKSNEEELNQQLVEISQALKIDIEKDVFDSYPMSRQRIQGLNKYYEQLIQDRDKITRTATDQNKLLSFLESYHATEFGSVYRIDEDLPMSLQAPYVLMLPDNILPADIFIILSKPSARYVQTEIDNMEFEMSSISGGIEVVCVQTKSF
jgi:uncharacterized protein YfkK (UPF0435 family)